MLNFQWIGSKQLSSPTMPFQIFKNGETTMLEYGGAAMINDFQLLRDVILINVGTNKNT